jgi:hypothetical protein
MEETVDKCAMCVMRGDLEGLKKLKKEIPVRRRSNLDRLAASYSRLEIVKWLHRINYRMNWRIVVYEASKVRCWEILKFAYETGPAVTTRLNILYWAVSHDSIDILDWSQTLNPPMPLEWSLIECAIEKNSIKSLRWLIVNECPFGETRKKFDFEFKRIMLTKVTHHTQNVEEMWRMWRLWRSFGNGGCSRYEKYVEWPPEEVMKDVIELMTLSLMSELIEILGIEDS